MSVDLRLESHGLMHYVPSMRCASMLLLGPTALLCTILMTYSK